MIDLGSSSRFNWTRLLRTMTSCVLNNFADGNSTVSQDSLLKLLNFKGKKIFLYSDGISSFWICPHFPLALLVGTAERSLVDFFILSHRLFIPNDEIPLEASFLQAEEFHLSQPRLIPPAILVPLWCTSLSKSGEPRTGHSSSEVTFPVLTREEDPLPAGTLLLQLQVPLYFCVTRAHCQLWFNVLCIRIQFLYCKAAFYIFMGVTGLQKNSWF